MVTAHGFWHCTTTGVAVGLGVGLGLDVRPAVGVGDGVGCGVITAFEVEGELESAAVGGLPVGEEVAGGAPAEQAVRSASTTMSTACVARDKAVTWTAILAFSLPCRTCTACAGWQSRGCAVESGARGPLA